MTPAQSPCRLNDLPHLRKRASPYDHLVFDARLNHRFKAGRFSIAFLVSKQGQPVVQLIKDIDWMEALNHVGE